MNLCSTLKSVETKGEGPDPLRGSDRHAEARRTWQLEMEMVGAARARAAAYNHFHLFSFVFIWFHPALLMLVLDISGCLLSSVLV